MAFIISMSTNAVHRGIWNEFNNVLRDRIECVTMVLPRDVLAGSNFSMFRNLFYVVLAGGHTNFFPHLSALFLGAAAGSLLRYARYCKADEEKWIRTRKKLLWSLCATPCIPIIFLAIQSPLSVADISAGRRTTRF